MESMTESDQPPVVTPNLNTYQISEPQKGSSMRVAGIVAVLLIVVGAGVGTGFGLSKVIKRAPTGSTETVGAPGTATTTDIQVGKVYGTEDAKKFPDQSEGIIQKGGIDGEGTHHLVRQGGKSQTVYLTSSALDLDLFVGDKVQIKGQTFSAQKASWFMDVASVKVLEKNAQLPAGSEPADTTGNQPAE